MPSAVEVRNVVTETAGRALGLALAAPGSEVTLLTGGTGLKDPTGGASGYGGNLLRVRFRNSSTTNSRTVKLYLVASGGSVAEATLLLEEVIPPKGVLLYEPKVPDKYKDSATLKASQDSGTDVYGKAEAIEFY
jgi:hypothetical protein